MIRKCSSDPGPEPDGDAETEGNPEPDSSDSAEEDDAAGEDAPDGSISANPKPDTAGRAPGCADGGLSDAPTEAAPEPPSDAPNPAAIRSEAMTYAKAVVDLCRLAGQPQMATGFLARDTDLEAVRKALIEARAETEPEIDAGHPQPGPGPASKPWGDVIARTFKLKG